MPQLETHASTTPTSVERERQSVGSYRLDLMILFPFTMSRSRGDYSPHVPSCQS